MPTLTELESDPEEDSPSSATVSNIRGDNQPSPALGLLRLSPRADRKRKGVPRVSASPAVQCALSLQERFSNENNSAAQSIVTAAKSPKRSKAALSRVWGPSLGDSNNVSGMAQKRKAEGFSDTENQGDGSNGGKPRTWRKNRISSSLRGDSVTSRSDDEYDDAMEMEPSLEEPPNAATSIKSATQQKSVYELLSSESEEEKSDDEESVAKRSSSRTASKSTRKSSSTLSTGSDEEENYVARARRGRREWLTSFHATNSGDTDDSSSSSDDTSECDDIDRKLKSMSCRNWLTSSSREDKVGYLDKISNDNDKALQMLLWDIGFDYKIHQHQFEAIRFVGGFVASFPCEMENQSDDDVQEILLRDEIGRYKRDSALNRKELMLPGRGLGKTIEALGGAALRNARKTAKDFKRPTLIVTPQDGVQHQWLTSLSIAGVEPARITIIGEQKSDTKKRGGDPNKKRSIQSGEYIICTRYKIQSEIKNLFDYNATAEIQANKKRSVLFGSVPVALIKKLRHEYNVDKGKENGHRNERNEARPDRVTRIIRESIVGKHSLTPAFETVIIDECHFLRNVLAMWGMGSAILGARAKRTVLLSGTPYNNNNFDMSALMTFIDPKHEAARVKWWDKATSKRKRKDIVEAVSDWRKEFMMRRLKDVLKDKLPPRKRSFVDVPAKPSELGVYEWFEAVFLKALNQLQEEIDDNNRKAQNEMVEIMMSCMACMRMSLIHPVLPVHGREVTIQFSPSRRHLLRREESKNKKKCVLCGEKSPTQRAEEFVAKKSGTFDEENDEDIFQQLLSSTVQARRDEDIMGDDSDEPLGKMKDNEDDSKGPIVELGPEICQAAGSGCCHFAHERCIEILLENNVCQDCPRCSDLASRIHITNSLGLTGKSKGKKIFCQEIGTTVSSSMGFTASSKIEKAVKWFQECVPENEKAIILSFFKGSLDLIEGILTYDLGVYCCRYDGDVSKEKRKQDLDRFKTNKKYRVLLASVQSGGTGLNITEANNVLFLDRWFNPQTHEQAESRCHRMGQDKIVKIAYLDTSYTADVVMKHVNTIKEQNAEVLLADGTSLGHNASLDYNKLAGLIGDTLKAVIDMRHAAIMENAANGNADAPLLFERDSDLESKIREAVLARATQKKAALKKEENSDEANSEYDSPLSDDSSLVDNKRPRTKSAGCKGNWSPSTNGAIASSDDDSDDDILKCEPTFCAKPHSKAIKCNVPSKASLAKEKDSHKMTENEKMPAKLALTGELFSSTTRVALKADPEGPHFSKSSTEGVSSGGVIEILSSDEEKSD